jgi:hypothetical protein
MNIHAHPRSSPHRIRKHHNKKEPDTPDRKGTNTTDNSSMLTPEIRRSPLGLLESYMNSHNQYFFKNF